LKNVDFNTRLIIGCGGEDFRLVGRDRCVAFNQLGAYATKSFNAEAKRRDVEENNAVDIARENAALDRRADGDDFVRVHALVGAFAEEFFDSCLNHRNTGRTADKDDFLDFARLEASVSERLAARL